ncbi:MAG: hypothetical protein ACYTGZ_01170 [Planctomycetota bacterium]|jgi:hypothetical protein
MSAAVDEILQIRANPRPDPLRLRSGPPWMRAIPAAVAALAAIVALLTLSTRDLGLVACGAALWSAGACAARGHVTGVCLRLHMTAGMFALALFRGAEEAGQFAPVVALLVVAALAARASAYSLRRTIAPMAGRVPWRFRSSYRLHALRYGAVGLAAALALVAFAPNPVVKIIGVACVPLALRTFALHLLSPRKTTSLWMIVAFFHMAALAAFVPAHGAMAAAWIVVASETMLLAGAATVIARSTGVSPFPRRTLAVGAGSALLLCALAIPGTGLWPILVTIVVAAVTAIFFWR